MVGWTQGQNRFYGLPYDTLCTGNNKFELFKPVCSSFFTIRKAEVFSRREIADWGYSFTTQTVRPCTWFCAWLSRIFKENKIQVSVEKVKSNPKQTANKAWLAPWFSCCCLISPKHPLFSCCGSMIGNFQVNLRCRFVNPWPFNDIPNLRSSKLTLNIVNTPLYILGTFEFSMSSLTTT